MSQAQSKQTADHEPVSARTDFRGGLDDPEASFGSEDSKSGTIEPDRIDFASGAAGPRAVRRVIGEAVGPRVDFGVDTAAEGAEPSFGIETSGSGLVEPDESARSESTEAAGQKAVRRAAHQRPGTTDAEYR